MPPSFDDLKSAMKTQPRWLEPPPKQEAMHVQKFCRVAQRCFGLVVNVFPGLGYCTIVDEVVEESLKNVAGLGIASGDWVDVRKGDLFGLIESLRPSTNEDQ
jgi:hypothetical protein